MPHQKEPGKGNPTANVKLENEGKQKIKQNKTKNDMQWDNKTNDHEENIRSISEGQKDRELKNEKGKNLKPKQTNEMELGNNSGDPLKPEV